MTRSEIHFGVIPEEHWSYPAWVDQEKAAKERQRMEADHVIYAGSESYRHMCVEHSQTLLSHTARLTDVGWDGIHRCRYNSGFFFKHPIMQQFDYYWRVEP